MDHRQVIRHFYHVYAGGAWAEPVTEHIAALRAACLAPAMTIGLIGPAQDRRIAKDAIGGRLAPLLLPEVDWIEQDSGFEELTLAAVRQWAAAAPADAVVLYAHTKGAYHPDGGNAEWRRSMTRHVVGDWDSCLRLLEDGHDTVGCHWLTPERHHRPPTHPVVSPFYGGNFWWARASYIRRLPAVATSDRFAAEQWIGLGNPRAADLLPGWPKELCLEGSV